MTPTTSPTTYLFVLLACNAPVGVILRRNPRDWTQMIHWDTRRDIFTPGQWFHGHLYTDRCDLSPDGTRLLYFAAKHWRREHSIWTAVSKPPYFTALKIWFQPDTYGGGGVFGDEDHVWLHQYPGARYEALIAPPSSNKPKSKASPRTDEQMFAGKTAFHVRLARDGWTVLEMGKISPVRWQKQSGNLTLFLAEKYIRNRGVRYDYRLLDERSYDLALDSVPWADFDQQKRLVLAKAGKLFSAAVVDGELSLTELADFNANQPEAIDSPAWAKKW